MLCKMSEWKEYKFSDFVDINPLVSLKGEKEYSFVEMKDLQDGVKYCLPKEKRKTSSGARFNEGDTLFARITPCLENGKICSVKGLENGVGFGSTEFLVFRGKKDISDTNFIYYLSRWEEVRNFAENNFEGTSGRQRVPKNCFDNLKLNLPGYNEQIQIANILSSLDDKIDLLHRQNKTLEQLAETVFRQWFVVQADEKWLKMTLSSIAIFLNGLACQKFPPTNDIDKLPVLKIKELSSGITESSDWASTRINPEYIVKNGDVIFSWSATLIVKIWDGRDCILNQHLFKVTSKNFPKWFYYLWCKFHLAEFISISKSHATTMGHIKRGDLDNADVLIPSNNELEKMSNIFEPLIEKIITNNNQLSNIIQLRDALLPRFMNGEISLGLN